MSWTLKDTLLHCGPWEILPDDRPKIEAAARRYSRDPTLSKRDRDYIERMWLPNDELEPGTVGLCVPGRCDAMTWRTHPGAGPDFRSRCGAYATLCTDYTAIAIYRGIGWRL